VPGVRGTGALPLYVAFDAEGMLDFDVGPVDRFVGRLAEGGATEEGDVAVWLRDGGAARLVAVLRTGLGGKVLVQWL
jgi:hypothetical protein